MKNLELKIPPAAVWFICALIMWVLARLLPFGALPHLPIVAIFIAGIGIGVGLASLWSFYKVRTTINPLEPSQATHFVSKGVYQLSRNPMYVGLACCLLAWAIWLSYLLTWIGIPRIYSLYDAFPNHPRRARSQTEIWQRIRKLLSESTPLAVILIAIPQYPQTLFCFQ